MTQLKYIRYSIIWLVLAATAHPETWSQEVSVGGNFLSVWNYLRQKNDSAVFNERRQFDFAVNLDFNWLIHEQVTGTVQLQSSPGDGSFSFPGPDPTVVDLFVEISIPEMNSSLAVGSFDAPFGITTNTLTNNANTTESNFFLNPIFYSVFAGSPTGILNVVGATGNWETRRFEITAATFNGLDESSANVEGHFGYCGRGVFKFCDRVKVAGSYLFSRDKSGQSILLKSYDTFGWLAEGAVSTGKNVFFDGYYGKFSYDDGFGATWDDVAFWQFSTAASFSKSHIAFRISGWLPYDNDGDGFDLSPGVPTAGLAVDQPGASVVKDQDIIRYQLAAAREISPQLLVKAEYFRDDYRKLSNRQNTDVDGLILMLQGSF